MSAKLGNKLWKLRKKDGRSKTYEDPEKLWEVCVEYFEWIDANPLIEEKVFHAQGLVTRADAKRMRAMTIGSLCVFLDIGVQTWRDWRKFPELAPVVEKVEQIIWQQKFAGAAADLLNANIISRELGLAERQELSGRDGGPIELEDTGARDKLAALISARAAAARDDGGSEGTDG